MTTRKSLWIVGVTLLALGVVASAVGQASLWAEMDAIDAAGPAGPSGTLFGFGGITTIAGALLAAAGIVVLIVAVVRAFRARPRAA